MGVVVSKDDKIPIAYCEICKSINPIHITTLQKKEKDGKILEADIGWCVVCETVLNVEDDTTIEWVGEEWLEKHGWKDITDKDETPQ